MVGRYIANLLIFLLGFTAITGLTQAGAQEGLLNSIEVLTRSAVKPGTVVAWAGNLEKIPQGWELCDGHELSPHAAPELFAAIGTNWGGDGKSGFRVPNLSGMFLRGVDVNGGGQATGHDPDHATRGHAAPELPEGMSGNAGNLVGSRQTFATAVPQTNGFVTNRVPDHTHLDPTYNGNAGPFEVAVGSRGPAGVDYVPPSPTSPAGAHEHSVIGGDKETRPTNAYVFWIIKVRD